MLFASRTTTTALLFVVCGVILGANGLTITTAEQLVTFSNNVNSGTSYSGTTVYLESDIVFTPSLSQQFQPIGKTTTNYFNGTFDGQGHIINNLALSSSSQYTGLFGYSRSATIKNVVINSSCSIKSSCTSNSDSGCLAGSIVGECRYCVIENVVNMAKVTLSGDASARIGLVLLGGIAGRILGSNTIRNCVNYGSVSLPEGFNVDDCELGGIVGISGGGSDSNHFIHNCANYGNIESNGSASILVMGGIIGDSWEGTNSIENCVSAGKISTNAQSGHIGAVVGYNNATTTIAHCLWTNDVGYSKYVGSGNVAVTDSSLKELNTVTMNNLNTQASKNSTWDKWLMLHLNGGRINDLNQETIIVTQKHFPSPVKEWGTFLFWCLDAECTERYDPQTTDITGVTELYAGWSINMVTFNFRNGTITTRTVTYGKSYGTLPSGERTGHTFAGWFTGEEEGQGERITEEAIVSIASDHTLYAQWTINNYTITFVFNNGDENEVRVLNYNESIDYPENVVKEGYTFNGWSPKPVRMPAEDVTVTAHWIKISSPESKSSSIAISSSVPISSSLSEKSSESISSEEKESSENSSSTENATGFVEIVFGKKDLKEEEVREFIREYVAPGSFAIMKIENDEQTGGTRVIVKFDDADAAKSFVEVIRASSDKDLKIIRVGFVDESVLSFSGTFYLSLLNLIFVI